MNDLRQRLASLSPAQRALLEQRLTETQTPPRQATSDKQPRQRTGGPAALSFSQQRLWFLDQLLQGNSPYSIPTAVRLSGLLDVCCLERSINAVIRRHEVLRTNIKSVQGRPFQIVADEWSLKIAIIDLSTQPEAGKESEASRILTEEAQRPFDLAQDLMLRATLVKLSSQEHILLLVTHHIASDGWSMGILTRDLSHFYEAGISGRPSSLPELPIQYADYAEWQRGWLQGKVLEEQLDYWKQKLAGAPNRLDLSTDRPRPAVQTFRGASRQLDLSPELTQGLRALSLREKVTQFMTLLAAFQVLLFRYTGQDDIVVGSPIAGRNRGNVEGLIGCFINTLAMRTNLSGDPTFLDVLRRVREVALEAYEHQELPFERLVEDLHLERSLSQNPLFQVMFVLQNTPSSSLQLSGLQVRPARLVTERAHFDLTLAIAERPPGLIARLSYSTDLFEESTIDRMLGHFEVLLKGIVKRPEERISRLPLLTREEWIQLRQWNDTRRDYPSDRCLHELFEDQVRETPDAGAVTYGAESWTYEEVNRQANQLGHYMRKLGVGPDVPVGLCVERSVEMVVGLLGILKAGGAYVPLDPAYPEERLRFMLENACIAVVVTQEKLKHSISALAKVESGTGEGEAESGTSSSHQISNRKVICLDSDWEAIAREEALDLKREGTAANLAYVIYTSGSTGRPKGVQITHQAVVNFLNSMRQEPGLTKRDRLLSVTTLSFDIAGLELFLPLSVGAQVILVSREDSLDGRRLLEHLAKPQATAMQATPITWRMLLEAGWKGKPELKILCGGETLSRDLADDLVERGASVWNLYGPTETTIWSAISQVRSERGNVLVGRPIANTQIFLLDSHLQPVPIGVAGELYIGGDGLARGYWNLPELTAEKFVPNPFGLSPGARLYKTGDMARLREDGNVEHMGRIDNQVKLRGFRIELGEIESCLSHHEAVREAVVVLRENDQGEKQLVAYVATGEKEGLGNAELRDFLKKKLPGYMVPSAFVTLDSIPRLPNGKVNRFALPPLSPARPELEEPSQFPLEELEFQLKMIWEDVLDLRSIGFNEDFFEAGGNSFLAVRLFAQIEQRLGKKLPLATLFQATTIADLAALLRQQGWSPPWASLVPIQPKGSAPPFFCVHAHRGEVLVFRDLARHLGMDQPFYGLQAKGLAEGEQGRSRIEEMADHYLQEIRALQSGGPYYLGGLCFGAKVALEIAHRLVEKGEKVALLAMLDAFAPGHPRLLPWSERAVLRVKFHFENLKQLRSKDRLKYVYAKVEILKTRIGETLKKRVQNGRALMRRFTWDSSRDQSLAPGRPSYSPRVYPGSITVFSPSEQLLPFHYEPDMGWAKFAGGGLEIHVIPGRFSSIIAEPAVGLMAEELASCLARARSDSPQQLARCLP